MSHSVEILSYPEFFQIPYVAYSDPNDIWNGKDRCILSPLHYSFLLDGRKIDLDIPYGFISDLGSVPDACKSFVDDNDESILGYLPHDFLFHKDCPVKLTRSETDAVLYAFMERAGQGWWRMQKTYYAVRLGRFTGVGYHETFIRIDEAYADMVLDYAEANRPFRDTSHKFMSREEIFQSLKI